MTTPDLLDFYGVSCSGPSDKMPLAPPFNGFPYFADDLATWFVWNGGASLWQQSSKLQSGATGSRPESPPVGTPYFDTSIGQAIVWNGAAWTLTGGDTDGGDGVNGLHSLRVARFTCDVTGGQYSGAVGTFDTGVQLPAKAIVRGGLIDIPVAFVGAGASLAVQIVNAGDLLGTTAVASLGAGQKNTIPNNTAADAIKLATAADVKVVISGDPMTAGTLVGFLDYVVSQ